MKKLISLIVTMCLAASVFVVGNIMTSSVKAKQSQYPITVDYLTQYYWEFWGGASLKYEFHKDGTYAEYDHTGNLYRTGEYSLNNNVLRFNYGNGYGSDWIYVDVDSRKDLSHPDDVEYVFYLDGSEEYGICEYIVCTGEKVAGVQPITVALNGKKIEFDQPPIMAEGDRVMVPMRAIFEELGYNVSWYQYGNGNAYAVKGNDYMDVFIGEHNIDYSFNGSERTYYCDVVPQIVNERTLVPVRAIAECAGCTVEWDGVNSTVIITSYNDGTSTAKTATVTPAPPTATLPPSWGNDIETE